MFILYVISSSVTGRTQLYYLCEVSLENKQKKKKKVHTHSNRLPAGALNNMEAGAGDTNQWQLGEGLLSSHSYCGVGDMPYHL